MKHTILPVLAILLAGASSGCDGAEKRLTSPDGAGPRLSVGVTTTVSLACPGRLDRGTSGNCVAFGYDVYGYLATQTASWSSSNSSLVSVSGGVVTGSSTATGTATITATINNVAATANVAVGNSNALAPSVSIGGPSSIKPDASCWWFAGVLDDADPPLTYSWSQSAGTGTSYGSSYQGASSSSFTLYVTVTDGNGHSTTASKNVTVASNAGTCSV
jgi:hypothetical protein